MKLKYLLYGAPLLPLLARAADPQGPQSVEDVISLFERIVGWVSALFWIAAVLFIIYAAFLYLTAAGNPEKIKMANSQLLYSVIAIIVALMATVLPTLIGDVLSGGSGPSSPPPGGAK